MREAKKIVDGNIRLLRGLITAETPLVGIEPSAILTFRDEYPDLVADELLETAREIALNSFLIDDFLAGEADRGFINSSQFTREKRAVLLHGHCQQKALSSVGGSVKMLSLPANYTVSTVPSKAAAGWPGPLAMSGSIMPYRNRSGNWSYFLRCDNKPKP